MMDGWKNVTFGEICTKVGDNYQPVANGNLPYVGLEHIEPGSTTLKSFGNESEIKSSKTKYKKGQILYGKLRPYLDKSIIAPFEGICSTDILVFNATDKSINDFIVLLIHTDFFINHANATTSGVQHPRTSWNSLKTLKLQLPPPP